MLAVGQKYLRIIITIFFLLSNLGFNPCAIKTHDNHEMSKNDQIHDNHENWNTNQLRTQGFIADAVKPVWQNLLSQLRKIITINLAIRNPDRIA